MHTVYGGAHLFRPGIARKLGDLALREMRLHAPEPGDLVQAMGVPESLAWTVYQRVVEKLEREPIEDYRVDFEDGYGPHSEAEEEAHAREAARIMADGDVPASVGIRIRSLGPKQWERSLRTLRVFLERLSQIRGRIPENFVVTLPKIVNPEEPGLLADCFEELERRLKLEMGSLRMEIMIETPQAVMHMMDVLQAARGRCVAAHFGAYDYTGACGITAAHQSLLHPACDFARQMMLASLHGAGVWLSDGATHVLPVGETESVWSAWALHYRHVRHAMVNGFYQGWDLHPAQLVSRYVAVYTFFLEGLPAASRRVEGFAKSARMAALSGNVFDDAASASGLRNFFDRALGCGAIRADEAPAVLSEAGVW